ncbi:Disease resistance response protein [Trema orientale]|uniref:Dirigent protein n=1 Tax=Trema orientale TaxID=63057 RepID=A0A2P5CMF4_TREOI|nr:Disease resistance response protein [Trema orientale]
MLCICPTEAQRLNQTNIVFFLQDVASTGPNATVVPVIGITGKAWTFATFGTIFAIDDPITETPSRSSNQVGRAQGMLVTSALDGSNVSVLVSIVFTNREYGGSTLELQGVSRQNERYREVSVVSGTGTFRFARGFAIFETIYYERTISYSIIRCTITLLES